jgi:ParB family transcriptional regulator, chromosome partitioning protein
MTIAAGPREFKELPIGLLDDPELPSRSSMDDDAMRELVGSIRLIGLQQPMIVARTGERFEVIAGHRRRIACERAGLAVAPCIIYPSKDAAHVAIQYAENRFREELGPTDEALLFAELLERDCNGDVDVLCTKLGEKRAYVETRLLLLRDQLIFDALREQKLGTIGVALQLLKVTDLRMRHFYLDAAIRGGATVAVVSGWLMDWQAQQRAVSGTAAAPAPAAAPGAVPNVDYFRCYVCRKTDNVHTMQPINVHSHCQLAILDELLAAYRGEPKREP